MLSDANIRQLSLLLHYNSDNNKKKLKAETDRLTEEAALWWEMLNKRESARWD